MSIETRGSYCLQDFSTEFRCFFSIANREEYVKYLKEQHKDQQIISDADRICCHIFNLLNSGEIFLGDKILWNKDYKTGFVWDNKYYTKIKAVDFTNNSDVKFCWELSRFQHMITLSLHQ